MGVYILTLMFLQNADYMTGQVYDLADKLEHSEAQLGRGGFNIGMDSHEKKSEDKLAKATKDGCVKNVVVLEFTQFVV